MMLKLHVVPFEVVAVCCVTGGANILAEHPYTDNTHTVLLQTRLHGAISMTTTSHDFCFVFFTGILLYCYIVILLYLFWCFYGSV